MTGMKIWQIKTRKADQADFEMAEIQHNRREPVLGEVIDVAVKRKGVRAKIVRGHAPPPGLAGTFYVDAEEVTETRAIDFDYDLEEIVQMDGVGPVSLKSALRRMPDRIGPHGVLYRDKGKTPAFFDAAQIEALLALHRSELNEGNLPDRRDADEIDFDE
jgi:hypothetical protein